MHYCWRLECVRSRRKMSVVQRSWTRETVKSNRFHRGAVIVRVISRTKQDMTYFALLLTVSLFLSTFPPSLFSPRLAKADEGEDKVERHSPLVKVAPRSMSPPCRFGRIRARKPGSFSCRENFIHVTFPFQILLQIFSINCHEIVIPYSILHFCNMTFG